MKIAIPTQGAQGLVDTIAEHFGRAEYYTFVEIDENQEIKRVQVEKTPFSSHTPGQIPNWLKSLGADVIIASGMGRRALSFFENLGIKVITGISGTVKDAVEMFLRGEIKPGEAEGCSHSGECQH